MFIDYSPFLRSQFVANFILNLLSWVDVYYPKMKILKDYKSTIQMTLIRVPDIHFFLRKHAQLYKENFKNYTTVYKLLEWGINSLSTTYKGRSIPTSCFSVCFWFCFCHAVAFKRGFTVSTETEQRLGTREHYCHSELDEIKEF